MEEILESEIDAMITKRILVYHSQLIKTGQIKSVGLKGPVANQPIDDNVSIAPRGCEPLAEKGINHKGRETGINKREEI